MERKLHVTWRHRQLQLTILVYQTNCNVWNGLSLRFCHGHGIDWSNWIVGVVLLIGYWKNGNQLMIATNKKSVI